MDTYIIGGMAFVVFLAIFVTLFVIRIRMDERMVIEATAGGLLNDNTPFEAMKHMMAEILENAETVRYAAGGRYKDGFKLRYEGVTFLLELNDGDALNLNIYVSHNTQEQIRYNWKKLETAIRKLGIAYEAISNEIDQQPYITTSGSVLVGKKDWEKQIIRRLKKTTQPSN